MMPFKSTLDMLEQPVDLFDQADIRYQTLFESSFEAISILDPNSGKFIDCNQAALNFHKINSRESFLGLPPWQLSPRRQPNGKLSEELATEYINDALLNGVKIFDWTHTTIEGDPIYARVTLSPMTLNNKKLVIAIVRDITEQKQVDLRIRKLNELNEFLLVSGSLTEKLQRITDCVVDTFKAEFARIWLIKPGDRCSSGCIYGRGQYQANCQTHAECLHLMSSSGRYTHLNGSHARVPQGAYNIGKIANGQQPKLLTNEVAEDPNVYDHEWVRRLSLKSFAGYRLLSDTAEPMGVLALFSRREISEKQDSLLEYLSSLVSQVVQTEMAKEALHKKEGFLRAVLENIPYMIFVKDARDLRFTGFNKAGEALLGYPRESLYGKSDFDFFPKDEAEFFVAKDREVLQTGTLVDIPEEKINTRYKGERYLHTKKIPIVDKKQKPQFLLGISEDITEKRQAEQLLRRQAQVIDQIHDSVISVDMEGFITSWNKGSEHLFRYSEEEIIGEHVSRLYPESFHRHLQEDAIPTLLAQGNHGYDTTLIRKDGSQFAARVSLSVLRDENGAINGMIGYTLDITDQKRAEAELLLSEERFRAIFESTNDCILVWDRQYNYLYANQAAIDHVGTTRDKVVGKNIRDGLRHVPDFMHLWMERIDQVFETKKPLRVEDAVPVGDNTVYSESVLSPIFGNDGSMFAVGVVYRDVTERKFMEDELKRLAATDPLTGADNRRSFLEKASYELLRSQRYKHPFALLMLDVDHFKSVNDTHGHKWGDQVLKTIVAKSVKTLRDTDLFGRIGGEEFAIILPETDTQAAIEVSERLRQTLSQIKISTDRGAIQITVSIGLAIIESRDDTLDTIMGRADAALYEAKQAGRNKLVRG